MKKILIVLFSLFVLVGCASDENEKQPQQDNNGQEENNTNQVDDENENNNQQSNANAEEDTENENASDNVNAVNNDHLKEFEEFDVLEKELDLDIYGGIVKSDNKGNRIILFQTEDGKKEYKSIFVKNNHRLKIVHFDNEDNLLYNKEIK